MNYKQVINHFGGISKAAAAFGITKQRVYAWHRQGRIPTKWQVAISRKTGLPIDGAARKQAAEYAEAIKR